MFTQNEFESHREETFLRSLLQNTMHASDDARCSLRCYPRRGQRLEEVSHQVSVDNLEPNIPCVFYRGASGTLGLQNQLAIAQSTEMSFAVKQVQEIQRTGNHITAMLSHADLIQLGGYAAVEYCGGPAMIFAMGREDVSSEGDAIQHAAETHAGSLVTSGLAQSDLFEEEFVALMGSFTLGFQGEEKKGAHTRWCMNPYVFDNTYFQELLLRDKSKYFKTEADLKLVANPQLKNWVEAYAQDQDLFFRNYAKAFVRVSEFGHEGKLLSEFEPQRQIDGGYMEESRLKKVVNLIRIAYSAQMTGQSEQDMIEAEQEEAQKQIENK